ncbi:MAG: MurR/RpiR family transcriptional regulator [Chloroflexi bacterium]|nr:MurR/RpiR family transcriptional regulator [Chloroflexota bacterium]
MEELTDFRRRIEGHFGNLTKREKRIASFLLSNHDQATFLTGSEIAKHVDVSEATVVRFAKSIGYKSFPELRRALQEIFRVKVTPAARLQRKLTDLKSGQGDVLHQVVDMELQYLAEVPRSISTADFDRAVKIILKGRRLFIFGSGPSRILAELVQIRFNRFALPSVLITETGRDMLDKLLLLKPDDAVLATGFYRDNPELGAMIGEAHKIGCKIVLLTDTLGARYKDQADVILSARRGPVSTFHSLTVPMAILNAIILAVAMERSEATVASLDRLQALRAQYGFDFPTK